MFALTPVAALMFRFNNPDALLLLLLVVAAYCTQRACEKAPARWWVVAAGVAVGVGFLAKMLQALLVLPALARRTYSPGIAGRDAGSSTARSRRWRS